MPCSYGVDRGINRVVVVEVSTYVLERELVTSPYVVVHIRGPLRSSKCYEVLGRGLHLLYAEIRARKRVVFLPDFIPQSPSSKARTVPRILCVCGVIDVQL